MRRRTTVLAAPRPRARLWGRCQAGGWGGFAQALGCPQLLGPPRGLGNQCHLEPPTHLARHSALVFGCHVPFLPFTFLVPARSVSKQRQALLSESGPFPQVFLPCYPRGPLRPLGGPETPRVAQGRLPGRRELGSLGRVGWRYPCPRVEVHWQDHRSIEGLDREQKRPSPLTPAPSSPGAHRVNPVLDHHAGGTLS